MWPSFRLTYWELILTIKADSCCWEVLCLFYVFSYVGGNEFLYFLENTAAILIQSVCEGGGGGWDC